MSVAATGRQQKFELEDEDTTENLHNIRPIHKNRLLTSIVMLRTGSWNSRSHRSLHLQLMKTFPAQRSKILFSSTLIDR
jgi:hypothetical protein